MNGFFQELRHGRVYRTAVSYAVVSWLVLQMAAIVSPALGLPAWTLPATIGVLLCGFTAVLWVGWVQDHRRALDTGGAAATRTRRHHLAFAVLSLLPAIAVAVGFIWLRHPMSSLPVSGVSEGTALPITEKSIAVLPFDSLSEDKSNAYFTAGMQDEILTDLAKVADLKVISRTSVAIYGPDHLRNVREIGRTLRVAHVLEGSVQKAAGRVRVTAQLIDARTDTHLWADRYDRDAADIFAIQSEIAERIAASLRARLSPDEKAAIDARPTADLMAYDLYLQAKELVTGYQETDRWRDTLLHALRLLEEATARDPRFALAYCEAAKAHDNLYSNNLDPTPVRLALEENAVAAALRLQPDLGEARLARARLLYHGERDYPGTRRELARALAVLPNSAQVFSLTSYLDRRQGRWAEALRNQNQALSLDPGNVTVLSDQTVIYDMLRFYRDEIRVADTVIAELPASANYYRMIKAAALLAAGRTAAARADLNRLPPDYDPNGAATYTRVCVALYDGHPEEAARLVAAFQGTSYPGVNGLLTPRAWMEALVARAAGDRDRKQAALTRAREDAAAEVLQRPEDPDALAQLGLTDAGLGRKDDALREARGAVAMRPLSADAMDGPGVLAALALVCAWTDEPDEAMRHLTILATEPGGPDYGQLRFDPAWASLRGRPDFQLMVAHLDPHLGD